MRERAQTEREPGREKMDEVDVGERSSTEDSPSQMLRREGEVSGEPPREGEALGEALGEGEPPVGAVFEARGDTRGEKGEGGRPDPS